MVALRAKRVGGDWSCRVLDPDYSSVSSLVIRRAENWA